MRVAVVDPPAFTPPYDHALCEALATAGADVELLSTRFPYGEVPQARGYVRREFFYRRARGGAGSRVRRLGRLAQHLPDMVRLRGIAPAFDVVHFQWVSLPWVDGALLPSRPLVFTAHDLLPREPRPGQVAAHRRLLRRADAVVVHSRYGRRQLIDAGVVAPEKVHIIHHGAFDHLARLAPATLPEPLAAVRGPVVLFFGLLRPYKGIETLLEAWRGIDGAELWIVGRPRMPLGELREYAPDTVRFVTRFVSDRELAAFFRRAEIVVLPYARTERFDQSGVLATALAFAKPIVLSDVGGFAEVAQSGAALLVAPGEPEPLRAALADLLADAGARERLGAGAAAAAAGPYSWRAAADRTLALYRSLGQRP